MNSSIQPQAAEQAQASEPVSTPHVSDSRVGTSSVSTVQVSTSTQSSAAPQASGLMRIEVAHSPAPREVELLAIELPVGSTVRAALQASGLADRVPEPAAAEDDPRTWRGLSLAVFGRKLTLDSVLVDGDRLDCCRPLRVDPKLARRQRFNQQGSRRSGLFARKREGSVAGY